MTHNNIFLNEISHNKTASRLISSAITTDTIPYYFMKDINLIEKNGDEQHNYGITYLSDGSAITTGHIGQTEFDQEGYIVSFDTLGNINWAKILGLDSEYSFLYPSQTNDVYEKIWNIEPLNDSTAVIAGQRYRSNLGANIDYGFIAKIGLNGDIIWAKQIIPSNEYILTKLNGLSIAPDGSIFLTGFTMSNSGAFDSFILKIDHNGNILNTIMFDCIGSDYPAKIVAQWNESNYYFFANCSTPAATFSNTGKLIIIKTDSNLNILQTQEILANINDSIRLQGYARRPAIRLNDLYYIPLSFSKQFSYYASGLIALDSNLNIVHKKIYTNTSQDNDLNFITDLTLNNNKTIQLSIITATSGPNLSPTKAASILLDSTGNLINSKLTFNHFIANMATGDKVLSGKSSYSPSSKPVRIMRSDFQIQEANCELDSIGFSSNDFMIVKDTSIIETLPFNLQWEDIHLPARTIYPDARDFCCSNLPDPNIVYVHPAYPCGDSIGIAIKLCNSGDLPLTQGYPISVYDSNPTTGTPNLLNQFTIDTILENHDCWIFAHTILAPATSTVFVVAGDNGTTPTPYEINCDFPITNMEECGYHNNIRSAIIPDTISIITFDNEYFLVCPFAFDSIQLAAPPYLLNPIWNGTFATDTLPVFHGGWYHLEAMTPCGELWSDSLFVDEQFPHIEFNLEDTTICVGDTFIIYTPSPHESIAWIFDNSSISGTCIDSCSGRVFTSTTPGTYLITGGTSFNDSNVEFCFTLDTFNIHVVETFDEVIDTTLCNNSSIEIYGQTYPAADTTLYFPFENTTNCDSVYIYQLHVAPTYNHIFDTLSCSGDSIWWAGTPITAGESHTFNFQSAIGCDSTVTIQVGLLDTYQTEQQQTICPNDSILLFNQWQNQPGFYEQYYTAINGCDSLHIIDLLVYPELNIDSEIQASCPDEATGQIDIQMLSGAAPFNFEWSNGMSADSSLQQVTSGNYTLTITDINACSQVFDFSIPVHTQASYAGACTPQWYAPTAFSPNGDGINDRFTFYGNERAIRIEQLQIWDRWGNQVFEANDIAFNDEALGWDGLLKGKVMRSAVFVWKARVLLEGGGVEVAYGDLLLMR